MDRGWIRRVDEQQEWVGGGVDCGGSCGGGGGGGGSGVKLERSSQGVGERRAEDWARARVKRRVFCIRRR